MAAPSKLTLGTRNLKGVQANLRQYGERAQARARKVVTDVGQRQYERTYELCPVATGHMRDHIQLLYTKDNLSYQIGWNEEDFVGQTNIHDPNIIIRTFYPLYQEFGTRFHAAHPCLFPARDEFAPVFKRALAVALRPSRG
jgi:hypothetical protein